MTITEEPPTTNVTDRAADDAPAPQAAADEMIEPEGLGPLRIGPLIISWLLITVVGVAVVLAAVGPISEERDQRALLNSYRVEIESASNQAFGLAGIEVPTQAPAPGAPIAVIDIEGIQLSRVVVEGTDPAQTRQGPGHVVGTGGPGQPGNSVIVARRSLFGGAFADLESLRDGDRILITTTQGRSVYEVDHVGTHTIESSSGPATAPAPTTTVLAPATDLEPAPVDGTEEADTTSTSDETTATLPDGPLASEDLYGPSPDDRLTLISSASENPLAADDAVVVVAHLEGQAFAPTPQGGRTPGDDGRGGASGLSASLVLALLAYLTAVVGAIWLHRNVPWRSAYLLSAPVLVALTIVVADELAGVLPAWS